MVRKMLCLAKPAGAKRFKSFVEGDPFWNLFKLKMYIWRGKKNPTVPYLNSLRAMLLEEFSFSPTPHLLLVLIQNVLMAKTGD